MRSEKSERGRRGRRRRYSLVERKGVRVCGGVNRSVRRTREVCLIEFSVQRVQKRVLGVWSGKRIFGIVGHGVASGRGEDGVYENVERRRRISIPRRRRDE